MLFKTLYDDTQTHTLALTLSYTHTHKHTHTHTHSFAFCKENSNKNIYQFFTLHKRDCYEKKNIYYFLPNVFAGAYNRTDSSECMFGHRSSDIWLHHRSYIRAPTYGSGLWFRCIATSQTIHRSSDVWLPRYAPVNANAVFFQVIDAPMNWYVYSIPVFAVSVFI